MDEKKYYYVLDNIKGLFIMLVVFGHFLLVNAKRGEGLCFDIYSVLYMCHMPVFMFVSGFLTSHTKPIWFYKMTAVYLICNAGYFAYGVYAGESVNIMNPAYSMWYLLLLIIFRGIVNICEHNKLWLLIIAGFSFGFLQLFSVGDTFVGVKIGAFFIYFVIGYFFKIILPKIYANISAPARVFGALLVVISVGLFIFMAKTYPFSIGFLNHSRTISTSELFVSLFLVFINLMLIVGLLLIVPDKKLIGLSYIGQISLVIYLVHRIITLQVSAFTVDSEYIPYCLLWTGFLTVICMVCTKCFAVIKTHMPCYDFNHMLYGIVCVIGVCITLIVADNQSSVIQPDDTVVYPEISRSQLNQYEKISYVGDMLLFENDVKNRTTYDDIFDAVEPYLGDYRIGIFEGVVADELSTGNYYDRKYLTLRYPKEFAKSVAKSFNLVNICTNHLLDDGLSGIKKSQKVFDEYEQSYVGINTDTLKLVKIGNLNVAVLAYTDVMNYPDETLSGYYKTLDVETVASDIQSAKTQNVDMIIAMLHIGEEFSHTPTTKQVFYNEFLASQGVDIVLSDHSHVVQPVEYIGDTLICNCPGNFFSSLTTSDQDYGMIFNMYIDKSSAEVACVSVVPVTSVRDIDTGIHPVACKDVDDIAGTNVVLRNSIGVAVDYLRDEYAYDKSGYLVINEDVLPCYPAFENESVAFLGDSITAGTMNNAHGWYEYLKTFKSYNFSVGGATAETVDCIMDYDVDNVDKYVIAVGCNDLRHTDKTAEEFVDSLCVITDKLNQDAEIIIVSPWYTGIADRASGKSYAERQLLSQQYTSAMKQFCEEHEYTFIDMYSCLDNYFQKNDIDDYSMDAIHPIAGVGTNLYSKLFSELYLKSLDK